MGKNIVLGGVWFAACLFLGGFTAAADGGGDKVSEKILALDDLAGDAELWKLTVEQFEERYIRPSDEDDGPIPGLVVIGKGGKPEAAKGKDGEKKVGKEAVFEWLSTSKDAARYQGTSASFEIVGNRLARKKNQAKVGGVGVGETIVRFRDGKVSAVEFSIFNRGDEGLIEKDEFEGKLKAAAAFFGARSKARMEKPGKRTTSAARAERMVWRGREAYYQLEYSFRKNVGGHAFVGEFINLKIVPPAEGGVLAGAAKSKRADRGSLKDRVEKRDSGDVLIGGVPMVDQGAKGYCAVASAERVLRYYGLEVDQHEMAQIAQASAAFGTDTSFMVEALEKVAGRLKVRVRTEFEIDDRDFDHILRAYNRSAKKSGATEPIDIPRGRVLNPVYLLHEGHPETLKEARASGLKYERFKKDVVDNVNIGVPLLWSLYLGIFPEEDIPQPSGGHMRIITGYNAKTDELIYTDSWGAGHEEKRMKFDEAYTMTLGVRIMVPSR